MHKLENVSGVDHLPQLTTPRQTEVWTIHEILRSVRISYHYKANCAWPRQILANAVPRLSLRLLTMFRPETSNKQSQTTKANHCIATQTHKTTKSIALQVKPTVQNKSTQQGPKLRDASTKCNFQHPSWNHHRTPFFLNRYIRSTPEQNRHSSASVLSSTS